MRVDCIVESINNIWRTAMEQGSQINAMHVYCDFYTDTIIIRNGKILQR